MEHREATRPGWVRWVVASVVLVILGVMAFKIFEPIQVLPRLRLAPGFNLTDQHGDQVTSEDLKGGVTLYTFSYAGCGPDCLAPEDTMGEVQQRLGPDSGVRFVTLSFDPDRDTPARLTRRAEEVGADGRDWFYATPSPDAARTVIGTGFREWYEAQSDGSFDFDPTLVLVDGWGVVRGEYQYQTLADDADRIVRHIGLLQDEIANSHGAARLAYEAAHLFLCYP